MINSGSKSSRLLASRRYTHDTFTDAQESFTNVLDLQASEVYTQAHKIPSGSLPFSGSSQNGSFHAVDGDNILRYYYRHKLTKSNLNNEVWFFLNPTGSASGIGAQLIDSNQQTNFISPKYSVSSLANATAEDNTPGYLAKVFISSAANSASVSDSDVISVNDYQFDYKTGVLQFKNSSVDPTDSQYVYMSINQYVGKTLADGVEVTGDISGSASSTGSFGHLVVAGNITASGVIRADAFESVTAGESIDFGDSLNVSGNITSSGDVLFSNGLAVNNASLGSNKFVVDNGTSVLNRGNSVGDILDLRGLNTSQFKVSTPSVTITPNITASGNLEIAGNISGSLTSTGSFGRVHIVDKIGVGILDASTSVHISASDGIIIPVGTTAQRSSNPKQGEIRFNKSQQTYEGYDGNNWGTLGGMNDVDQDTKITAETSAGADNDELIFFTAGVERLRIFADGHISASGNITASSNLEVHGDISGSVISSGSLGHLYVDNKIGIGTISPKNSLHVSSSDGIIIPVGTTAQRTSNPVAGEIRFNSQQNTYEGYDGNNWGTLGGVIDVDQDTRISAENNAGDDNDQLRFFTGGVERLRINSNGHISASVDITASNNLRVDGDLIVSNLSNSNIFNFSSSLDKKITAITSSISALKTDSGSFSTRTTAITSSISALKVDSGSFSTRTTAITSSISALKSDSGSFSTRVTAITSSISALKTDSGSFSTRVTAITSSISALKNDSASFSLRVTQATSSIAAITSSIDNLKTDSGSFSLRITQATSSIAAITSSINALKVDSGSMSLRMTQATASIAAITSSINNLKTDSGSFSLRTTDLETTSSALINNFNQVQSLGKTDDVLFSSITASDDVKFQGDLTVDGKVTAQEFHTEIVSSSIVFTSGSTKFGDSIDDSHNFTGSLFISGNLTAVNLVTDSGSVSTRLTAITSSISALKSDSGSFSTRTTAITSSISALKTDSGSFSTRVTAITSSISGLKTDSGSFSTRVTAITSSISGLKTDSGSFSTRLTAITSSISALKTDSGSMSLRMTQATASIAAITSSIDELKQDSGSFSLRITQATASIAAITSSIDELKQDSGSFSLRSTNLEITSSALINNFDTVQSLGTTDAVKFANITSSGDVSGSLSSTGSFGMIKKDGLDIREHFSRNTVEAFELDSNGDFQPTADNQYMVDPKWELDEDGNLQRRERELWTFNWDEYFSD